MSIKAKIKDLEKEIALYKKMEKDNKAFDRMSRSQKRLAIAHDVLAQIRAKKYIPENGTYFEAENDEKSLYNVKDAQLFVKDKDTTCTVCAIGSLFASKVSMGNKCDTNVAIRGDGNSLVKNLRGIFDARELRVIEAAFEGTAITDLKGKDIDAAVNWYEQRVSMNDEERLKAIMKNIIKNKGNFIP